MSHDFPYTAKRRVEALVKTLRSTADRDPEQVVQAVAGIISPETLELGEPIRATDALLVAEQLDAAIGPYPIVIA